MANRSWAESVGGWCDAARRGVAGLWLLEARLKGCSLGHGVVFAGRPIVSVAQGSRLQLADRVRVNSSLRANPLGCFQPSVLRTLAPGAELLLDEDVGMSATVLCALKSIRIGAGTIFGAGAMVLDNDFHSPADHWRWTECGAAAARAVTIGRGVFIGSRAIILKGVTIGDRAIVGAGAVVTRDVPARHLAAGNPAQVRPLPKDFFAGLDDRG